MEQARPPQAAAAVRQACFHRAAHARGLALQTMDQACAGTPVAHDGHRGSRPTACRLQQDIEQGTRHRGDGRRRCVQLDECLQHRQSAGCEPTAAF